ncbi:TetR family transcriptional regulator [Microlunatus soli]|uniref:Regulatory protein, tetR family n=1 Tax=Microlunatus soli TaxID=630515 RepID=A0A1H2ALS8_9ACTN|nr:TetR family transcriptional regulator [Microlunatus soli]SDT46506.1 regulatory protein, tetR family [Microlunatus soli]
MATSRTVQRERTRSRIAEQASRLFGERGYDRTTVRDIASAAAVDPALVLHYFGSKRALFRLVIGGPGADPVQVGDPTEFVLSNLRGKLDDRTGAVLSQLRSILTNPDAADHARGQLTRVAEALAAELPDRSDDGSGYPDASGPRGEPSRSAVQRAHLLLASTLGVTIARQLLAVDELASLSPDDITALLRPAVDALTRV